jgi:hypothetical protein
VIKLFGESKRRERREKVKKGDISVSYDIQSIDFIQASVRDNVGQN